MNLRKSTYTTALVLFALGALTGCNKKQTLPPGGEATAPGEEVQPPTAQLTATPTVISQGDQVQLAWRTTNANTIFIDGIGDVPSVGVKTVTPAESTTFHLVARGEGGSADATARVTVNGPIGVSVAGGTASRADVFRANMKDIFFDYDAYDIRPDAQATLSKDADFLIRNTDFRIVIGGYCDERGSDEYNLALGQNRAQAAKTALVTAGVAADRIRVVTYGKEKPFCTESNEECWQLNRRAGFSMEP